MGQETVAQQPDIQIVALNKTHNLDGFDCGRPPLNDFLTRFALRNQASDSSKTYLAILGGEVVGFYSIVVGQIEHEDGATRMVAGMPRHPIPTVVLARLGVSSGVQNKGIGSSLLKHALSNAMSIADISGVKAVVVEAKDSDSKSFYEHFGFEELPGKDMMLFMLMKDIRASAAKVVQFGKRSATK